LRKKIEQLTKKRGIMLDIGCGPNLRAGWVGMDVRKIPGIDIDIIHDWDKFPWPIESESVITCVAAHVCEHIKPWIFIDWFNELWRVMKFGGEVAIVAPYGFSDLYLQDPTHCTHLNQNSWQYFDPDDAVYYRIYEPKPWKIKHGPFWQENGNMEVILRKVEPKKK
jgi:DNA modification methylase